VFNLYLKENKQPNDSQAAEKRVFLGAVGIHGDNTGHESAGNRRPKARDNISSNICYWKLEYLQTTIKWYLNFSQGPIFIQNQSRDKYLK
jgi:hypothetical protein